MKGGGADGADRDLAGLHRESTVEGLGEARIASRVDARSTKERIAELEQRLAEEQTARRQAEERADRAMLELGAVHRELDRSLEHARSETEAAVMARNRFLAGLRHEMRTPLNGVMGTLELLLGNAHTDQERSYLSSALGSAERLDRLFNRLFRLVELDGGRVRPQPEIVEPFHCADCVERTWRRPAITRGFLLTVECFFPSDTTVCVDAARLREIIDELVDNAVTHGRPGSLLVRILPAGDALRVEVIDGGPGIDPAMVEQHFALFSRGDASPSGSAQGTGIGLPLSRALAEVLGGAVGLDAHPDGGTRAWVQLPLLKPTR